MSRLKEPNFNVKTNNAEGISLNALNAGNISISATTGTITLNAVSGASYGDNYRDNFTNYSLVDKGWVTSQISGETSNYVPYTGATTDVDLGSHDLTSTGNITGEQLKQSSIWHAYGGFQDETETLSIGVASWTFITNSGNTLWTGIEASGISIVDDELILTNAADYSGVLSITFEGGNGKDYLFRIYNVTQATQSGYKIGATGQGSGNYTNVTVPLYLEANAGDAFQIQVYIADGTDATFLNAIFNLAYIHS